MNRILLNGGPLNGAVRKLVLATALFACTATVAPAAVCTLNAHVNFVGDVTCTFAATKTHATGAADFVGSGLVYPNPTHVQVSHAELGGACNLQVYVLRSISADSSIYCSSGIIAVVASYQASGEITPYAEVSPNATRTQAASTPYSGEASIAWSANPVIQRMHQSQVYGQVVVRAEPTINGLVFSYVDFSPASEVIADALCTRKASGNLSCSAACAVVGTIQQHGQAIAPAYNSVVVAEPYVVATLLSNLIGSSGVLATGVISRFAVCNLPVEALISVLALQEHGGSSDLTAGSVVSITPTVISELYTSLTGTVSTQASAVINKAAITNVTGSVGIAALGNTNSLGIVNVTTESSLVAALDEVNTRRLMANSNSTCTVGISASALRVVFPVSTIVASADITSTPDTTVRSIYADLYSSIDILSSALITKVGDGVIDCIVDINAMAFSLTFIDGVLINCTSTVYADTVSNPEAVDPENRTFKRPAYESVFIRPGNSNTFRRVT